MSLFLFKRYGLKIDLKLNEYKKIPETFFISPQGIRNYNYRDLETMKIKSSEHP